MAHISGLSLVLFLPGELIFDPFLEAFAALAFSFDSNLVGAFVEDLVDFESLDQLADSGEVAKSEESALFLVEQLEDFIDFGLAHMRVHPFRALPKLVLLHLS